MFEKLIGASVRHKGLVFAFTFALLIWGIYAFSKIRMDALPDITDNQVQIITTAPDLNASEMERLVSAPLEQQFLTVPKVEMVRSLSRPGLSIITIVFKDEAELYWIRQVLSERLIQASEVLPAGLEPELSPPSTGLGEIYQYTLKQDSNSTKVHDAMELRDIQDRIVRKTLLGIPGLAEVNSFGGYLRQFEIALRPEAVRQYALSIDQIKEALEKNHLNLGAGNIEKNGQGWSLRVLGTLQGLEDLRKIPIHRGEGLPSLRLGEIAEIQFGAAPRFGALTENGAEGVGGIVMALKGDNPQETIKKVRAKIEEIQKMLPEGVRIDPFLDRQNLIDRTMSTVRTNLIEASLIVFGILFLFLGHLRASLIVVSVIPLSLCFSLGMLYVTGRSVNLISLGALDFGLLVDGAVILVEAMLALIALGKVKTLNKETREKLALHSSYSMLRSALFGQCIILAVYVPLLALQGIEGRMFAPMAWTVGLAMLGSMILCMTWVPAAMACFIRGEVRPAHWHENALEGLAKFYGKILTWFLARKKAPVLMILILLGLGTYSFSKLGGEFLPELDEGDFALEMRVLPGSSLNHVIASTNRVEVALQKAFPEVIKVVSKIGSSEIPTDPMPIEAADVNVILKPRSEWKSAETREELAEKMATFLKQKFPDIATAVEQPVQMRFNELLSGSKQQVSVSVLGPDLDTLQKVLNQLQSTISTQQGVKDLVALGVDLSEQKEVRPLDFALEKWNLNKVDIGRALRLSAAGEVLGQIQESSLNRDIVLRFTDRQNMTLDLSQIPVVSEHGDVVNLDQVSEMATVMAPSSIQRLAGERKVSLGFNVRGEDVVSVVERVQAALKNTQLPQGYRIEYGGSYKNLISARERLSLILPVVFLLILICLFMAFRQIKMIVALILALPVALAGGSILLALRELDLSVPALIGFIALAGIAILNGIVLLVECQKALQAEGEQASLVEAAQSRLRPVLMTASLAALGFLPMALSTSAGAEIQRPLATVVMGGLLTATLVTLFLLPWLSWILSQKSWPKVKIKGAAVALAVLSLLAIPKEIQAQNLESMVENHPMLQEWQAKAESKLSGGVDLGEVEISKGLGLATDFEIRHQWNPWNGNQQKSAWNAQKALARAEYEIKKQEARIQLAQLWSQKIALDQKQKVLERMDSVGAQFAKSVNLRLQTGSISPLEKTLWTLQKSELEMEKKNMEHALKSLVQSSSPWENFQNLGDEKSWWEWTQSWPRVDSLWQNLQSQKINSLEVELSATQKQNYPTPFWSYQNEERKSIWNLGVSMPLTWGLQNAKKLGLKQEINALQKSKAYQGQKRISTSPIPMDGTALAELRLLLGKSLEMNSLEKFQLWKIWAEAEFKWIANQESLRINHLSTFQTLAN